MIINCLVLSCLKENDSSSKHPSSVYLSYFIVGIKVARYSFSGSIPLKFEHKLRRHKQSFGKIATTVVLEEDENLFLSGL